MLCLTCVVVSPLCPMLVLDARLSPLSPPLPLLLPIVCGCGCDSLLLPPPLCVPVALAQFTAAFSAPTTPDAAPMSMSDNPRRLPDNCRPFAERDLPTSDNARGSAEIAGIAEGGCLATGRGEGRERGGEA